MPKYNKINKYIYVNIKSTINLKGTLNDKLVKRLGVCSSVLAFGS